MVNGFVLRLEVFVAKRSHVRKPKLLLEIKICCSMFYPLSPTFYLLEWSKIER